MNFSDCSLGCLRVKQIRFSLRLRTVLLFDEWKPRGKKRRLKIKSDCVAGVAKQMFSRSHVTSWR